ncbi:hypothetical protein PVAP13_9NG065918 [Panicum virgatum]|uniref:Uncharacterized protein n=1 Tax=Panicum virgatum TaxID=38727 RepID=A0A8T0MGY6_PANVG|nr:hypothetical protein PVAP13_9NG065918 [Panicum virgatum]
MHRPTEAYYYSIVVFLHCKKSLRRLAVHRYRYPQPSWRLAAANILLQNEGSATTYSTTAPWGWVHATRDRTRTGGGVRVELHACSGSGSGSGWRDARMHEPDCRARVRTRAYSLTASSWQSPSGARF